MPPGSLCLVANSYKQILFFSREVLHDVFIIPLMVALSRRILRTVGA